VFYDWGVSVALSLLSSHLLVDLESLPFRNDTFFCSLACCCLFFIVFDKSML